MKNEIQVEFVSPPAVKVELLSLSEDAVKTLAILTRGYAQNYTSHIRPDEVDDMVEQLKKTRLRTPAEFIQTIWLIKDVTRAFTHQLVRYRIGTQFVQESMRFADKRRAKVLLPPEVAGSELYQDCIRDSVATYGLLIEEGVPTQDARGVLPHNILTDIFMGCSLATLQNIASQRWCCQAQHSGEWDPMLSQMKATLPAELQSFIKKPWESGITSCGFGASFDRPCKYQAAFDKVIASKAAKVPVDGSAKEKIAI